MDTIVELPADDDPGSSPDDNPSPLSADFEEGVETVYGTPPTRVSYVQKGRRGERKGLPGRLGGRGSHHSSGSSSGRSGGKRGKSGNKARDKARDQDRRWKSLETTAFVLGISKHEPPAPLLKPEGINTPLGTPRCLSPRSMRRVQSEMAFQDAGEHGDLHTTRSWQQGLPSQAGEALPSSDGEPEPLRAQRAKQHAGWMKRLQCALEPSTDRRLAEISNQAKQLAAELLGPAATPQQANIPWEARGRYLERLQRWQARRADLSTQLRGHRRGGAPPPLSGPTEADVWREICEVAFELVRLGRDCSSNIGNALANLTAIQPQQIHDAFSMGVNVLRFLLVERDNILLDPTSRSQLHHECQDKFRYMSEGAYDVVEGALQGAKLVQAAIMQVPGHPGGGGLPCSSSHQALLQVWSEVPNLMDPACKVASTCRPLTSQDRYSRLVDSMLELAVEALQAFKLALRDTSKQPETEGELLDQAWMPYLLLGLKTLADEVSTRVAQLRKQDDGAEACDLDGKEDELFWHLCETAFSVAVHVRDLAWRPMQEEPACLDLVEEMGSKVLAFIRELFADQKHWHRCSEAESGIADSIMTCSDSVVDVVVEARRLKEAMDGEADEFDLGIYQSIEPDSPCSEVSAPLAEEASPFMSSAMTPGTWAEPNRTNAAEIAMRLTRKHSGAVPSHISKSMSDAFPGIRSITDAELKLRRRLAGGSFGEVWQGCWHGSGDPVAVKVIKAFDCSYSLPRAAAKMDEDVLSVLAELKAFRELQNDDNIVTFHDIFWWSVEGQDPNAGQRLCFVMEYCGYGTLYNLIEAAHLTRQVAIAKAENREPPEVVEGQDINYQQWIKQFYTYSVVRLSVAHQIAKGLCHMHQMGFIHRDLTSYNVLLTQGFHEHGNRVRPWLKAKVADFGYTRKLKGTKPSGLSETRPSLKWQAPEVLSLTAEGGCFSQASDVYSFGIIVWELITLQQPWGAMNELFVSTQVAMNKLRLQWPEPHPSDPPLDTREQLMALVDRCWAEDAADRPTMAEVVAELAAICAAETEASRLRRRQAAAARAAPS